jgi:hypothetical protein
MILITSTACSGGTGPVAVDTLQLAKDNGKGSNGDVVTEFHPADGPMHCVVTLNHPENGTQIHMDFIAVDAGGEKNKVIQSVDLATGAIDNTADGHLTMPNPWPVGKYQCAVTLNGKPAKSLDFAVTASP